MSFELEATVLERDVSVSLEVGPGETIAVLGPNGSGKSTVLDVIAGLLRPDRGHARLDARRLFDVGGTGRGHWLPPHARGVSMLAQDALLFPHLSVRDNVAFGPRSRGRSRAEAGARAAEWLERVDAAELADRRPAQLSGGQAQRIAVARALAADPALLLLDEPMAALDVSVAPALRRTLRTVLAGRSTIIVTHDVLDAFTLADRVVVLDAGRVVDSGPTAAVLERPRTPFAAGLTGVNLLTGVAEGAAVVLTSDGHRLAVRPVERLRPGSAVAVSLRPAAVSAAREQPPGASGRTTVPGRVTDVEPRGDTVRVRAGTLAADVSPRDAAELDLAPGVTVWFSFAADDATAYPL
ncbi:ABC transporter ATP-binding protein [Herbiconiux sp. VKM Ac-1786]|uniref:sulfate/molybdate ABC transporter ATP-binding protein n=1 Tax=Herbiconiux sp. VKM Ac-1786 TaxID=2783824 RepID=UPI00188B3E15|nr:ABC transporter ATP-binding protein [Herbiconiux sp. VKM Ac-1786]MBF4571221.1 ABC transporter ATP-binding protein [Herbiconiux sp. VKM Ac-1786]